MLYVLLKSKKYHQQPKYRFKLKLRKAERTIIWTSENSRRQFHSFLASALDGCESLASCSCSPTSGEGFGEGVVWDPEPVWIHRTKEKPLSSAGNWTAIPLSPSPYGTHNTDYTLSWLPRFLFVITETEAIVPYRLRTFTGNVLSSTRVIQSSTGNKNVVPLVTNC